MNKTSYTLKVFVLFVLLFLESLLLTDVIVLYVKDGVSLMPTINRLLTLGILMLLISYTHAFTIGAWNKWEQYILIPIPLSLGIFFSMTRENYDYAIIFTLVAYLLFIFDVHIITQTKNNLINFSALTVFRGSAKRLLLSYALFAAVMVFIVANQKQDPQEVSALLTEYISVPVESGVMKILQSSNSSKPLGLDTIIQNGALSLPGLLNIDVKSMIADEITTLLYAYKNFLAPSLALLTFFILQFVIAIVSMLFTLTVWLAFFILKRSGVYFEEQTKATKTDITFLQMVNYNIPISQSGTIANPAYTMGSPTPYQTNTQRQNMPIRTS